MRLALVRILVFGAVVHLASPIALWNVAVSSDCKVYMAKKSVAKFRRLMKNVVVPAYDPDAKCGANKLQVIDHNDHVFVLNLRAPTDIRIAVLKHEPNDYNDTTVNPISIEAKFEEEGAKPAGLFDQVLGNTKVDEGPDERGKAPCRFYDKFFHAFIDFHVLYVTVQCGSLTTDTNTDGDIRYALMRASVFFKKDEVEIVVPPQDLIYLNPQLIDSSQKLLPKLASVRPANRAFGDTILMSHYPDDNKAVLHIIELHKINDTAKKYELGLPDPVGEIERIENVDKKYSALIVQYKTKPTNIRKIAYFKLNTKEPTKATFDTTDDKNIMEGFPIAKYSYYAAHHATIFDPEANCKRVRVLVNPELSPELVYDNKDPWSCKVTEGQVNTCNQQHEEQQTVNYILMGLGGFELLIILVCILLFTICICMHRRRHRRKHGRHHKHDKHKKDKKDRKKKKSDKSDDKDANNNDQSKDKSRATDASPTTGDPGSSNTNLGSVAPAPDTPANPDPVTPSPGLEAKSAPKSVPNAP